jgi:hypothetical protein
LSVYLSLVLVGGSAPALAHSALTRDFDIKNEIEFKDDLDNKPDNETISGLKADERDSRFIEEYAKAVLSLMKRSYTLESEGGVVELKINYLSAEEQKVAKIFEETFPFLRKGLFCTGFDYGVKSDNFSSKLFLETKFENDDISSFASSYNSGLNFLLRESQDKPETVILKSTEITFENNQIFIVTRLPRASIDELFARKVAK